MHLLCVCGMGRKSDCAWGSEAETMFQTANPSPENLPTVPFHSRANFDLPCFERNQIKVAKVADVHCVSGVSENINIGQQIKRSPWLFFDRSISPRSCA